MKEITIYTVKLTRYLQSLGFNFIKTIPDVKRKDFVNWVFEDTPEIEAAVKQYLRTNK